MDKFKRQTAKTIGIGGIKCPCCNYFRTFGCHGKQMGKLNKLRRSRLKRKLYTALQKIEKEAL